MMKKYDYIILCTGPAGYKSIGVKAYNINTDCCYFTHNRIKRSITKTTIL